MSDSLASRDALDAPSNGQAQQVSNTQPQSNTDGQPSDNGQVAKEDFRKMQGILQKQANEAKQEAAAARQHAQQLQQRMAQLEDQMAPDDFTRLENKAKRADEAAAYYANAYQQLLSVQTEEAKKRDVLTQVIEDFDQVKVEDLWEASGTVEAMKLAVKLQREREQQKQQRDNDKRERNAPDIGGGAPITSNSRWDDQYADAMRRKDSFAVARLLREKDDSAKRK